MKWKDTSRRAKGSTAPATEWQLEVVEGLTLVLYHPWGNQDYWHLHCYGVQIEGMEMKSKEIEMAKREAVAAVTAKLRTWTDAIMRAPA